MSPDYPALVYQSIGNYFEFRFLVPNNSKVFNWNKSVFLCIYKYNWLSYYDNRFRKKHLIISESNTVVSFDDKDEDDGSVVGVPVVQYNGESGAICASGLTEDDARVRNMMYFAR